MLNDVITHNIFGQVLSHVFSIEFPWKKLINTYTFGHYLIWDHFKDKSNAPINSTSRVVWKTVKYI